MTHYETILTLRSMAFRIPEGRLPKMRKNDKFRDLIAAGSVLNAILYAQQYGVKYQIAKLAVHKTLTGEILYLTGGLLYRAMAVCDQMSKKYGEQSPAREAYFLMESYDNYTPTRVFVDMRSYGLFRLRSEPRSNGYVENLGVNGRRLLFPQKERNTHGVPIARFADPDEVTKQKLEIDNDLHHTTESLIDYTIGEVILALETFICGMAHELGLTPTNDDLGLEP